MPIISNRRKWSLDKDFIITQRDPIPVDISPVGVEADEYGQKYVHKGEFIDAKGQVVKVTESGGNLQFSGDPIGILTERVNVTNGRVTRGVLNNGLIQAEYLPIFTNGEIEYDPKYDAQITEKLPHVLTYLAGYQSLENEEEEESNTKLSVALDKDQAPVQKVSNEASQSETESVTVTEPQN